MSILPPSGPLPDTHLVPDLLMPGLRLVFCGTALGRKSAEARAYYANPTNMFWRTLHEVGLTDERMASGDYAQLLGFGIGLTDLSKGHFGNDAELPVDAFDVAGLREKMLMHRPGVLAFTSKAGAGAFLGRSTGRIALGEQAERVGETRLFVLPSPSGAARRYWDVAVWRDLAGVVRGLS